ncbi:MAG: GIY-YIG nuclease family protein [Candidatus Omnitrophota bacterium]
MTERNGYAYLMTNKGNTVIYTGVTSDLKTRVYEHKEKLIDGFTKKYNVDKLVYYEAFDEIEEAIIREKQIKGSSRKKKVELINSMNPCFKDLYYEI